MPATRVLPPTGRCRPGDQVTRAGPRPAPSPRSSVVVVGGGEGVATLGVGQHVVEPDAGHAARAARRVRVGRRVERRLDRLLARVGDRRRRQAEVEVRVVRRVEVACRVLNGRLAVLLVVQRGVDLQRRCRRTAGCRSRVRSAPGPRRPWPPSRSSRPRSGSRRACARSVIGAFWMPTLLATRSSAAPCRPTIWASVSLPPIWYVSGNSRPSRLVTPGPSSLRICAGGGRGDELGRRSAGARSSPAAHPCGRRRSPRGTSRW